MALRINADNAWVELATDPVLLSLKRFTVCGWWNVDNFTAYRGLWSVGLTGAADRVLGSCEITTGKYNVSVFDGGLTKYRSSFAGTFAPIVTEWNHYASVVDVSSGTHDTTWAYHLINGAWRDTVQVNDASSTGSIVLPTGSTFRVGKDHDGDNTRFYGAYVRLFDRELLPHEIRQSMFSRMCPAQLRQSCPIDLPLDGDLTNYGYLNGSAVANGVTSFAGAVPISGNAFTAKAAAMRIVPGPVAATLAASVRERLATRGMPHARMTPRLGG